ncbi:hypothetical protein FCJ61_01075 [Burkholderia metallica]|nr:hypothetical protein [Burkholderia metallica]
MTTLAGGILAHGNPRVVHGEAAPGIDCQTLPMTEGSRHARRGRNGDFDAGSHVAVPIANRA